jgi:hypothetical protein
MKTFVSMILVLLLQSCAYSIHQVYIGSMDQNVKVDAGKWIEAETKAFVILGFHMDTKYIDQATKELESKCSGRIAQVTTEHLTAYWFLSYDQKVILKGLCLSKA